MHHWKINLQVICSQKLTYQGIYMANYVGVNQNDSTPEGRAAERPKDGLFRLHASWIYLSYAGFDCLAAILCH